jgi:hypothetical protein
MEGTVQCCYLDMLGKYNICVEPNPVHTKFEGTLALKTDGI